MVVRVMTTKYRDSSADQPSMCLKMAAGSATNSRQPKSTKSRVEMTRIFVWLMFQCCGTTTQNQECRHRCIERVFFLSRVNPVMPSSFKSCECESVYDDAHGATGLSVAVTLASFLATIPVASKCIWNGWYTEYKAFWLKSVNGQSLLDSSLSATSPLALKWDSKTARGRKQ